MTKKSERERRLREKTAMKTVDLFPSDLAEKIKLSAFDYQGDISILETAIGALAVGFLFGWRVLRMTHSSGTYSRYEKILGVKFKVICPDKGPLWEHSIGLSTLESLADFWKVVQGQKPGR